MGYFQQQDGLTHCLGLQAEQTADLKTRRRRQPCPCCPSLALVSSDVLLTALVVLQVRSCESLLLAV